MTMTMTMTHLQLKKQIKQLKNKTLMLTITYQLFISTTAITNIIKHLLTKGEAKQNNDNSMTMPAKTMLFQTTIY